MDNINILSIHYTLDDFDLRGLVGGSRTGTVPAEAAAAAAGIVNISIPVQYRPVLTISKSLNHYK